MSRLDGFLFVPLLLQAILRFAVDASGRYIVSLVSDGSLMIHDMEAARQYRGRVREAHKRIGLSLYAPRTLSRPPVAPAPACDPVFGWLL